MKSAILLLASMAWAQDLPQTAAAPADAALPQLPYRLELGGYGSHVTEGFGDWWGEQATLWVRSSSFFVPAFLFGSETRPQGTQQNYGFFSYLNWTKSFYTTQAFSAAPQNTVATIYFPKWRYDVKANWKVGSARNLVLGAGYTHFDLGEPGHGEIFNAGAIWYHRKLVVEGDLFVNRNQPGDLVSSSGLLSAQYGQEGKSWLGVTVGGGRELYQFVGQTPFNLQFSDVSFAAFYRRWLTRHVGVVLRAEYQDRMGAYQRAGGASSLFFEF